MPRPTTWIAYALSDDGTPTILKESGTMDTFGFFQRQCKKEFGHVPEITWREDANQRWPEAMKVWVEVHNGSHRGSSTSGKH